VVSEQEQILVGQSAALADFERRGDYIGQRTVEIANRTVARWLSSSIYTPPVSTL
jgi:hypothetical protein